MMDAILLIAHGSRLPEANDDLHRVAAMLREHSTSLPRSTCAAIAPATTTACRRQWRRKASVSACSLTSQTRCRPRNACSGQGICSIRQPRSRSTSTSGE